MLCDLLLLHFLQGRDYYKQKKFKYAEQEPVSTSTSLPARGSRWVNVGACPEPLGLSEAGSRESPLQNYFLRDSLTF